MKTLTEIQNDFAIEERDECFNNLEKQSKVI